MEKKIIIQIQQGDVVLKRREALPTAGLKPVKKSERGYYVIALGEATGHSHVIDGEVEVYEDGNGTLWIRALEQTQQTHEEHGPVTLGPGIYEVYIVREYFPFEEEMRRVAD